MSATVEKALAIWDMESAVYELAAARENQVYRIDRGVESFALRLHRRGYRSDAELSSELQWMDAVATGGLHVPCPVAAVSGDFLRVIDGIQIDVLSWLPGASVGATGEAPPHDDHRELFYSIGREMARLHEISDAWQTPPDFTRWAWNREGLLGDEPLWGRFWENPSLSEDERELFRLLRQIADQDLAAIETRLDYGLIHADLVRENVMVDGQKVQLIDFDDGGFGFRLFDLATTLVKYLDEPDYPALKSALISGYLSVRSLETGDLELFILLRAVTYVGWIVPRKEEVGSDVRNRRFIMTGKKLAEEYLARR